jgi:hypothetical protein
VVVVVMVVVILGLVRVTSNSNGLLHRMLYGMLHQMLWKKNGMLHWLIDCIHRLCTHYLEEFENFDDNQKDSLTADVTSSCYIVYTMK